MTRQALLVLLSSQLVSAVTLYGQQGVLTAPAVTTTADTASGTSVYDPPTYTGVQVAAFNPIILAPPPVPSPPIPTAFALTLENSAQDVANLSIEQDGAFLGFSIEMSVVSDVIGLNGSFLEVPFLNLMALVSERAGSVRIRVGGNTQDYAVEAASLPDYKDIVKFEDDTNNPTETPILYWTPEMLYMLNNVSALVNAKWWLGIPMNDTSDPRLQMAELGEAILGDNVMGFQLGNEPDLYAAHGHRPPGYSPADYFDDFEVMTGYIANDSQIPIRNNLVAPSVSGTWSPEQVWATGFIEAFADFLGTLAVEKYPNQNCAAVYPGGNFGPILDPQAVFPDYLTHASGQSIVAPYLASAALAQAAGKPFMVFETNTASCGGFPGVSDSFGAALWGLDFALQMAYSNFSGANMHVGGVHNSYNPFTPPPSNQSAYLGWTIGPIMYSVLLSAEALGPSGTAQVVDLNANGASPYTPAYAIYEHGQLARLALFNYVDDPSGASTYTANVSVGGAAPAQARAKYLRAPSVAAKENFTWAGQTFGNRFGSDGRLRGSLDVETVPCDQEAGVCQVTVPAPGFVLVFFGEGPLEEATPSSTATFSTSTWLAYINPVTATIQPGALATSNGESGAERGVLKSTSKGSSSGAEKTLGGGLLTAGVAAVLAGISYALM